MHDLILQASIQLPLWLLFLVSVWYCFRWAYRAVDRLHDRRDSIPGEDDGPAETRD